MIARLLAPLIAVVAAGLQMSRGAWVEAAGLLGLAAGLAILRLWPGRRWLAWACFGVTVAAMGIVLSRILSAS